MSQIAGRVATSGVGALHAEAWLEAGRRRMSVLLLGASCACALACACAFALALAPTFSSGGAGTHAAGAQGLTHGHATELAPADLAPVASASIGASDRRFWPIRRDGTLVARAGGVETRFSASGVRLRTPAGALTLSLADVGRGQRLDPVGAVAPAHAGDRVVYRYPSLDATYRSGPFGLEQGFTVSARPRGGAGELVLALAIRGSLRAHQAGSQVLFNDGSGTTVLHYGQLRVLDATGRRLPAQIQLRGGSLQLRIDDRHARYPLRIDPFIQQGGKLTGGQESFGESVALSQDGDTALIGGSEAHGYEGAAWIFTRSGETWSEQAELRPSGAVGEEVSFGESVALSGDGGTAMIAAPGNGEATYNGDERFITGGAVFVFTRSGSTWTQSQEIAYPGSEPEGEHFGTGVTMSADGDTALIADEGADEGVGAVWVFTRSGEAWTAQGEALTGSGEVGKGYFGDSLALSGDGDTALIGAPFGGENGAAWVFERSGETWSQQGEKLTGADGGYSEFGTGVALSGDGNTALIADPFGGAGAAYVFARSGETWTQEEKLTAPDHGELGASVALSGDGDAALIGSSNHQQAWPFTRSGEAWTALAAIKGTGSLGDLFGYGVALSGDGETALVGGPAEESELPTEGAAWAFRMASPPTVETGTASLVSHNSATLNGSVDPNGVQVSECKFEYGPTIPYAHSAPCSPSPGSGDSAVAVSAAVSGLSEGALYHFRVVAKSAAGTGNGANGSFRTFGQARIGVCVAQKKGEYTEGSCQTRSKKAKKGKFEWKPGAPPSCVAQKKGNYTEAACRTKSSKPKKGSYEKAPGPAYTATSATVTLETPALAGGTLVCSASTAAGEFTTVTAGRERITLTGCEASGKRCSSEGVDGTSSGQPGVVTTNLLATTLLEPAPGEVWTELASAEHEPYVLELACEGALLRIAGSLAGVQAGDVNRSSRTSTTTFASAAGEQALYSELSEDGGSSWAGPDATTLTITTSNDAASVSEIKT